MMHKTKRFYKIYKDYSTTRRMIKKIHQIEPHEIKLASQKEKLTADLLNAQKLHASVYLWRGFIDPEDIADGILTSKADPHQLHALYFILKRRGKDGKQHVAATARQIEYLPGRGFLSFPLVQKADINLQMLKELVSHDPTKCVEISGLAKHRETSSAAVLLLYRAMWHHSLKQGHHLWIMACDVRLYQRLRLLFGPAIKKIGHETSYKGGNVIPCMLNPHDALYEFIRISRRRALWFGISRKQLISFFVDGLPREAMTDADVKYLNSVLKTP